MKDSPLHVKFQNQQNPSAEFDQIKIEALFSRKDINHSIFDLHLVEFYMIVYFEEGEGWHTIDFTKYPYKKGTILTIRKDQIHKFHPNKSVKGTVLLFTDEFLVSYLEKLEALKTLQLFNELLGVSKLQLKKAEYIEISNLTDRISTEYFKLNDDYSMGIIRSELHILIAKLYRIKSQNKQIVFNRKYLSEFNILQNLIEKQVVQYKKVKDYAELMGLSSKTLNTVTRTIVNKSAKEFIDDICTNQIKRLLINTELSIKEIAYKLGFEETSNFYKYFKRQTLLTPEQFRNSLGTVI